MDKVIATMAVNSPQDDKIGVRDIEKVMTWFRYLPRTTSTDLRTLIKLDKWRKRFRKIGGKKI